jgi:hypothetical protein
MDVHDEDGDGIELEASTIYQDLSVPVRENKTSLPSTLAALKAVSFWGEMMRGVAGGK